MQQSSQTFTLSRNLSREDFERFAALQIRRRKAGGADRLTDILLIVAMVVLAAALIVLLLGDPRDWTMIFVAVLAEVFAVCYFFLRRKLLAAAMRRQNEKLVGRDEIIVDEGGIRIVAPKGEAVYRFDGVKEIVAFEQSLYLYLDEIHAIILPERSFTEGSAAACRAFLSEKTGLPVQTLSKS